MNARRLPCPECGYDLTSLFRAAGVNAAMIERAETTDAARRASRVGRAYADGGPADGDPAHGSAGEDPDDNPADDEAPRARGRADTTTEWLAYLGGGLGTGRRADTAAGPGPGVVCPECGTAVTVHASISAVGRIGFGQRLVESALIAGIVAVCMLTIGAMVLLIVAAVL